ncbi:MAG TPA: hypothetical protein DEP72_00465 [Clostridiales bacterium]|nr:MAG: hypothetical protein A2Y18_01050 [Clostridiales bacterium GWD2_32_19]HCC06624.1 hypothetical protein [Clostridiales bacterium]
MNKSKIVIMVLLSVIVILQVAILFKPSEKREDEKISEKSSVALNTFAKNNQTDVQNKVVSNNESESKDSQISDSDTIKSNSTNTNKVENNNTTADNNTNPIANLKLEGSWNIKNDKEIGTHSNMKISNVVLGNESETDQVIPLSFDFDISADYAYTIPGTNEVSGHEGRESGKAELYAIDSEKYLCNFTYVSKEYPDYLIDFTVNKDNTITIKEVNKNTGNEYGSTPMAGTNVRFIGTYYRK